MERVGRRSAKRAKKVGEITRKCLIFRNQKRAKGRKPRKVREAGVLDPPPPPALPDSEINRRLRDSSRFPNYVRVKL